MDISQLIAEHGACFYLIAFVWTFLEGETFVLFAGFAAAQGLLNPILLLLATLFGSAGRAVLATAEVSAKDMLVALA